MKLPRDVSGRHLAKALELLWYRQVRQTGSHIRMTTARNGEHHLTIPNHDRVKIGTIDVAAHHHISRDQLARKLFGSVAG
ncbi:MAG: type II toxin-antitoxin system HicA family toxin [Gaiellales bacterium]